MTYEDKPDEQDPDTPMTPEDEPDPDDPTSCPRLTHVAVDDQEDPSLCILPEVTICNTPATCQIDLGATSSYLCDAFRRRVNLASTPPALKDEFLANGSLIKILRITRLLPTDDSSYACNQKYPLEA
jgi:hypothetical protein